MFCPSIFARNIRNPLPVFLLASGFFVPLRNQEYTGQNFSQRHSLVPCDRKEASIGERKELTNLLNEATGVFPRHHLEERETHRRRAVLLIADETPPSPLRDERIFFLVYTSFLCCLTASSIARIRRISAVFCPIRIFFALFSFSFQHTLSSLLSSSGHFATLSGRVTSVCTPSPDFSRLPYPPTFHLQLLTATETSPPQRH